MPAYSPAEVDHRKVMTAKELHERLGISERTLRRWLRAGKVPMPPTHVSGNGTWLLWPRKQIEPWLAQQAAPAAG
jgi:excisionase family DNA binding protein